MEGHTKDVLLRKAAPECMVLKLKGEKKNEETA